MTARPRRRATLGFLVAALALLALATETTAATTGRFPAPDVPAEATLVMDAETGVVIAADDPEERRPIASTTKLMTALLALRRAEPGETLTAAGYDPAPIESQIGLEQGERMAVRDLLVALLLESANDAAVTLAEGLAGSTDEFVADMNDRAARLGLDDTSYANPIGFDHPDNHSTARDLADLTRRLMRKGRFRDIVEEPQLSLRTGDRPRVVENRNELVGQVPIVDGVKTGHTLGAGHVLVGSATEDGNRVISVVLGAPSEAARDAGTLELIRFGLDRFRRRTVARAGEPLARAAVAGHDAERVALTAARPLSLTVLEGDRVDTRVDAPAELEGPLPADAEVGTVQVLRRGEPVSRVPLVTARRVPSPPDVLTRFATTLGDHPIAAIAVAAAVAGALALAVRRRRSRAVA